MEKLGNTGVMENGMTHGLILKRQWCDCILKTGKTWEIRGTNTSRRGRIGLIVGKMMYGSGQLLESHPLSQWHFEENKNLHQVLNWSWVISRYKRPHAWVIDYPMIYSPPKKVERRPGQIIWVRL